MNLWETIWFGWTFGEHYWKAGKLPFQNEDGGLQKSGSVLYVERFVLPYVDSSISADPSHPKLNVLRRLSGVFSSWASAGILILELLRAPAIDCRLRLARFPSTKLGGNVQMRF